MKFRVLRVLMWKHAMVRKRRIMHTILDLFAPLLFILYLYEIKDSLNIKTEYRVRKTKTNIMDTALTPLKDSLAEPRMILYHPDTLLAAKLMDQVALRLHLKPFRRFPTEGTKGYYPYVSESERVEYAPKFNSKDAVVIFQNFEGDKWPSILNYTIRMAKSFSTNSYRSADKDTGPHIMYGLNYNTFLRIQWAIDRSYIKLRTGHDIDQEVFLQEFPYDQSGTAITRLLLATGLLRLLCWLALLLPFVFLMIRLLEERTSGIQELMKMVGVSTNTLGVSHYLNVLPTGLIFSIGGAILLKVSNKPLIPKSNGFLIFLMLILYYNSVIAMAFAGSFMADTTQYAASLSVLLYTVSGVPGLLIAGEKFAYIMTLISGFFPHTPMLWYWFEAFEQEAFGIGISFGTMFNAEYYNNGSVFLTYVFLLIQIFLIFALTWYLTLVRPGKFGTALPWDFFRKKRKTEKQKSKLTIYDNAPETNRGVYFEPPPNNMTPGITVENVTKVYPKQVALRNVSLEVYKGEITVLLGHNGAGKTTLMSIITGMTSATAGRVLVNGKDTVQQRGEVLQHLGLCPQYELFFSDLTVLDHVMFFAMLKRGTFAEARQSSQALLDQLGIADKANALVSQLSGGTKRRVQLACALAGDADVLILDEPTSGLDVQTRRELWDLLLSLRGDRTVLLTTHFMEEADALGDRVAALHSGVLRCCATTMHLKKQVGTGYRLSFMTIGPPQESAISSIIRSHVPDAVVKETSLNSISYSLPVQSCQKFPQLFSDLESKRSELGIDSIGVGVSTLEEVFIRLCSDTCTSTSAAEEEIDEAPPTSDPTTQRLTGIPLYFQQFKVLLKRQMKYVYSRKWIFVFVQIFIPLSMICMVTSMANNEIEPPGGRSGLSLPLNLDMYSDIPDKRVLYNLRLKDITINTFRQEYPNINFQATTDAAYKILRVGMSESLEYDKYLVGIEVNEATAKALYTTTVRHAAPVALNMLSNLLASRYIPGAATRTITTYNEPLLPPSYGMEPLAEAPKNTNQLLFWALAVCFLLMVTNINSVSLPCKERETGSRHIHIMSGCPPELYWGTTLLFHMGLCVFLIVLPTAFFCLIFDNDKTTNQPAFLCVLISVLILGSLSFFAFMYLISFNFGERGTSVILVACTLICGIFTPLLKAAEDLFDLDESWYSGLLELCCLVIPTHTLAESAIKSTHIARLNTWCDLVYEFCPDTKINEKGFDQKRCCAGKGHRYNNISDISPGRGICIMQLQFIFYMVMVVLMQRGSLKGLKDYIMNRKLKRSECTNKHAMVLAEENYVKETMAKPKNEINDAMLVDNVYKTYVPVCRRKIKAVKGVSFSVKKGECFGLLGVNGAGKSTIFKMLTAEECATRGHIFANGHHFKRTNNTEYLQSLGYCPQFFGLDMFQTGQDNLAMILTLRGLEKEWVQKETHSWLEIIGLGKYADRVVSGYSGGCVRRLGAAAALCGGAPTVLLDEPTTGVDVSARRRLWTAIRRAQARERSVLITSHSLDEIEALSSRIAIMSSGRIHALGSAGALRAAHAQGYAVVFKLLHAFNEMFQTQMAQFQTTVQGKFNCTLKDEHRTMLHYHINETIPYSELFSQLEALKKQFPNLIEDYSVTDTTLEEVFLSFARENHAVV